MVGTVSALRDLCVTDLQALAGVLGVQHAVLMGETKDIGLWGWGLSVF